jgi:hypothetical protein
MAQVTLTEFLLTRIAEDEIAARMAVKAAGASWSSKPRPRGFSTDVHVARHDPARVLAECEAKRVIVKESKPDEDWVLYVLAAVYADHPDYLPEWKP